MENNQHFSKWSPIFIYLRDGSKVREILLARKSGEHMEVSVGGARNSLDQFVILPLVLLSYCVICLPLGHYPTFSYSDKCRTKKAFKVVKRMLPLFRAVVKFYITNRLFV